MFIIIFKIAIRNICRRKLQTISLGFMMAITTFAIFMMVGTQTGAFRLLEDSYTKVFNGDMQIRNADYEDISDFDKMLTDEEVKKAIQVLNNFSETSVYFAKRYINFGLANVNEQNYSFQFIGIDAKLEEKISLMSKKITSGSFLDGKYSNDIVLGQDLADFLKVKVGDEMVIMTTDIYDSFVIDVFRVKGIYQIGDMTMDKSSIFVAKEYFDDNIIYETDKMTNITIKIEDPSYRSQLKKQLQQVVNSTTSVLSWDEILPDVKQTIEFEVAASMLFYIILAVIVAFTLLNSMMLATIKRAPEFGLLSAMGLDSSYFKWILIFENLILSFSFVLIGSILGMIFVIYFANAGIPLPALSEMKDKPLTLIENILYPNPRNPYLLVGPLIIFVACMLSVIAPVIRLQKSNPIQSLTSL